MGALGSNESLTPGLYLGEPLTLSAGDRIHINIEDKSVSFYRGTQAISIVTNEGTCLSLRIGIMALVNALNFIALLEILLGVSIVAVKDSVKKNPKNILIFEIA